MLQNRAESFWSYVLLMSMTVLALAVTDVAQAAVDLRQCPSLKGYLKLSSDSTPDFVRVGEDNGVPFIDFQTDRYFLDNLDRQRNEAFYYKANCRNGEMIIETESRVGTFSTFQVITWSPMEEPGVFMRHASTKNDNGPVSEVSQIVFNTMKLLDIPEHVAAECPVINGRFEEHVYTPAAYYASRGGSDTPVDIEEEDESETPSLPTRSISTTKVKGGAEYSAFEGVTVDGRRHKNALGEYRATCKSQRIYVQFWKNDDVPEMYTLGFIKRRATTLSSAPEVEEVKYKKMGLGSYKETGLKRVQD